jgi:hypothetical protein
MFARLQRVAEAAGVRQDEWGGRQHFLRWATPDTWRDWEAAGLSHDSTLAYSEAVPGDGHDAAPRDEQRWYSEFVEAVA